MLNQSSRVMPTLLQVLTKIGVALESDETQKRRKSSSLRVPRVLVICNTQVTEADTLSMKENAAKLRTRIKNNTNATERDADNEENQSGYLLFKKVVNTSMMEVFFEGVETPEFSTRNVIKVAMESTLIISNFIQGVYDQYDGFVIVAKRNKIPQYASFLSFQLENLSKPVIVTGGLHNIEESLSDLLTHTIEACYFAGGFPVPEVCVYSCRQLFRGNRTSIFDHSKINGILSPNYKKIGGFEAEFRVNWERVLPMPDENVYLRVNHEFEWRIGHLLIFPQPNKAFLDYFFDAKTNYQAVLIESYGAGNLPTDNSYIILKLREAIARGLIVFYTTQCFEGGVLNLYEASASQHNIIGCSDLTVQSALVKIGYLLKQTTDVQCLMKEIVKGRHGETMMPGYKPKGHRMDFIRQMEGYLSGLSESEGEIIIQELIVPSLVFASVKNSNINMLGDIVRYDPTCLSLINKEGQNILHVLAKHYDSDLAELIFRSILFINLRIPKFGDKSAFIYRRYIWKYSIFNSSNKALHSSIMPASKSSRGNYQTNNSTSVQGNHQERIHYH